VPRSSPSPKTEFLQIRVSPDDVERLERIAASEHLDKSTWARRELLKVVDRWEAQNPPVRKVAEGPDKRRR
jgi:predicted transcriptional regulator